MSLVIGKAIYKLLSGNTTIQSYVNDNIYPIVAEDTTEQPFIIYRRANINVNYSKDHHVDDRVNVNITVVSNDYSQSITIADLVRSQLESYRGNVEGINIRQLRLISANEGYSDDSYIQELTFEIITTK